MQPNSALACTTRYHIRTMTFWYEEWNNFYALYIIDYVYWSKLQGRKLQGMELLVTHNYEHRFSKLKYGCGQTYVLITLHQFEGRKLQGMELLITHTYEHNSSNEA